ncbi:hypothetical protein Ddye_032772 [Dipteronia dyeriana]|uniref:Cyclic nucleotide-binding domain-containing protein n=1 Tax=Dipteronia dyeriana TaxID=168575 RepID=A0AAD9TCF5_9ROSI|nr:hypothetical protein Ddye_032772 [Dipteronia dyeriana]
MIMSQAALSSREGNTPKYDYKFIHKGQSYVKKYVKKILKPRPGYTGSWITFVLWIISISLDPFICYVPSIHDEENSLKINTALMTSIFVFYWSLLIYRLYISFREKKKQWQVFNKVESIALLFSSLFGGLWYLFAVWKKMECWNKTCSKHDGCHYANHRFNVGHGDSKFLNDICFPKTEGTKTYELGIFKEAFESRIVETTTEFWNKLLYCFRWGIQNLSGFGQNLEVSTHAWENIFVILIAIYGMGTFTFFIGNMQVGIHYFRWRKEEIRRKQEETEKWVPFRKLSEKLQNVIKEYQQYNWHGDVDVKNLLSNLPEDHEINVKRELCLQLLKKVEEFGKLKEASLLRLCDCVKPVVYAERTCIVRQGDPTDKMLFVLQGKLWTFSSSSRVTIAGSVATNSVSHPEERKDLLKNGDFWGEELVNWVKNNHPHLKYLIQTEPFKHLQKLKLLFLWPVT